MAVIVPNAPAPGALPAGARADPRAFDAGAPLANVGSAAFGALAQIDTQERAAALREARVAAAEQLGALRVQYEQTADWNGLTGRFERDAEAARAGIAEGLNPRARRDFDLAFREMRASHLTGLQSREVARRRDHERARLTGALDRLTTDAAGAPDEGVAAALVDQAADSIADARAAGWISAEEEQALISRAGARTANAVALRLMREDPEGLADRLRAGAFDALGPETVQRYLTSADSEAASRVEQTARAIDHADRERVALVTEESRAAIRLLETGLTPDGIEDLRARAAGTPAGAALEASLRAARAANSTYLYMTPAEQAEALTDFRSRPRAPGDEQVLAAMERVHAATVRSVETDLLGHGASRRLWELAPIALTEPGGARARIAQAEAAVREWAPNSAVRYFTASEREAWSARLRDASPEDQLALAISLTQSFGDRAFAALGELGEADPTFGHAGALVAATGDDRAARSILSGRRLLEAGQGAKPKAAVRAAAISRAAAQATEMDDAMRARLLDAADAHFAVTGATVAPDRDQDVRRAYEASLQAAAGGVTVGGKLFGGLQDVNGRTTILPPSLDAALTKRILRSATPEQLAQASLGGPPGWRDAPLDGPLGPVQLIYEGGGAYLVGRETDDGVALLSDASAPDGYFRLDLARLSDIAEPPPSLYERASGAFRGIAGELGRYR